MRWVGLREERVAGAELAAKINRLFRWPPPPPRDEGPAVADQGAGAVAFTEGRWLATVYQAASFGQSRRQFRSGMRKSR